MKNPSRQSGPTYLMCSLNMALAGIAALRGWWAACVVFGLGSVVISVWGVGWMIVRELQQLRIENGNRKAGK